MEKVAGYVIGENGKPIAPGVICKCGDGFCPAHATNQQKLRKVKYNQEFRMDNEIWHLTQYKDVKNNKVSITNRHGKEIWIDWETEVEVIR
jgi:hypothetical protein